MDEPSPRSVAAFVRSLAVLAMDADGHVAWLRRLGPRVSVDELALEFDDGYQMVTSFAERGWLTDDRALAALARLDAHMDAMSGEGNAELWRPEALAGAAEWDRVRVLAREALFLLA